MRLLHDFVTPLLLVLLLVSCSRGGSAADSKQKLSEEFSGERALAHVRHLVAFGPRPPGSEAIEKSRAYIDNQLRLAGWQVERQPFTQHTPRGEVAFVNLVARFPAQARVLPVFLLCSHYDTKFFENLQFVGANDGGSSTGVLLEMAAVLARHPTLAARVALVFFDGEEAYENFSETDGLYGSRYFAKQLSGSAKQFRGGILFDMVGDRSLNVTLPLDSPPQMAHDLFAAAEALKLRNYFAYYDGSITDDHTPLNRIGIPTIDIIDFDFAWWHTADDTMDKLSAESLHVVGSVAAYYLSQFALK
ncbi:MAG: M28 family peptidase [Chthoniobacterales bacterium]